MDQELKKKSKLIHRQYKVYVLLSKKSTKALLELISELNYISDCKDNTQNLTISLYTNVASQVVLVVKNLPANAGDIRDLGLIPGSGRSPRGAWQPTLIFLPGESHERRSLAGVLEV